MVTEDQAAQAFVAFFIGSDSTHSLEDELANAPADGSRFLTREIGSIDTIDPTELLNLNTEK